MTTATAAPEPNEENEKKEVVPFHPGPANQPKFFSLVPKDIEQAMKLADMLAASDLVPKDYKGKPGNCLVGMQFGAELGLPPMQALQNIAVINGKPGVYGDIGKALLHSHGFKIEERDTPETKAKGQAWCKITRPDGAVFERTFSLEDAKTAGLWGKQGPWTQYPFRQMGWRAFWFAARDAGSDVLKGLAGVEELNDYANAIETTAEVEPKRKSEKEKLLENIKPMDTGELQAVVNVHGTEPTPENPAVDVKPDEAFIGPEERKNIVALLGKHKVDLKEFKKYLQEEYGIEDSVKPSAFIRQRDYGDICEWIATPQEELGL
ncbi:MAG: hypothetical protein DMF62_02390 [Acidobacteria bacterium]|nr:MAG: hypothetical protein DMF62_02390 [Acidobacteriota bacterium]